MSEVGGSPAAAAAPTTGGSTPAPSAGQNALNQQGLQSKDSGSKAVSPGGVGKEAPQKPPSSAPEEMFEVKVNGKIVKMTRQEAIDRASMSYAANDKFNEAKKLKAEHEQWKSKAKNDFMEVLQDPSLGLTKDQIRDRFEQWYHDEYIAPEALTADQKKLKEYEAKIKKYDEEENQKKQQAEKDKEQKLTQNERAHLQTQIIEAMDKSGLPKSKENVKLMAFFMRQNLVNGWDAPIEAIIRQVREVRKENYRDEAKNSSVEQLIELFGDDVVNKIRQHDLENLRKKRQAPPASGSHNRAGTGPVSTDRIYSSDVNQRLKDIKLGKI